MFKISSFNVNSINVRLEIVTHYIIENKIDVIATDHAPHTLDEKKNKYLSAPSGGPLVQHALGVMLKFVKEKKISIEDVVQKMCHNPSICFKINRRGFIREDYYADIVLVDIIKKYKVIFLMIGFTHDTF